MELELQLKDLSSRICSATADPNHKPILIHWSDASIIDSAIAKIKYLEARASHINSALLTAIQIAQGKNNE